MIDGTLAKDPDPAIAMKGCDPLAGLLPARPYAADANVMKMRQGVTAQREAAYHGLVAFDLPFFFVTLESWHRRFDFVAHWPEIERNPEAAIEWLYENASRVKPSRDGSMDEDSQAEIECCAELF